MNAISEMSVGELEPDLWQVVPCVEILTGVEAQRVLTPPLIQMFARMTAENVFTQGLYPEGIVLDDLTERNRDCIGKVLQLRQMVVAKIGDLVIGVAGYEVLAEDVETGLRVVRRGKAAVLPKLRGRKELRVYPQLMAKVMEQIGDGVLVLSQTKLPQVKEQLRRDGFVPVSVEAYQRLEGEPNPSLVMSGKLKDRLVVDEVRGIVWQGFVKGLRKLRP